MTLRAQQLRQSTAGVVKQRLSQARCTPAGRHSIKATHCCTLHAILV